MLARLVSAAPPPDELRAALRARDALLARGGAVTVVPPEDLRASSAELELTLREPALALVPGGLDAAAHALSRGAAAAAPAGFFRGVPGPGDPYVTLWELEAEAGDAVRRAPPPLEAAPPIELRRRGADGDPVPVPGWTVHSFGGRRAHLRSEILERVPREARTVLDVGCAEGVLGAALQASGVRVTGIEPDPAAAAVAARGLSRVLACGLEEALPRLEERFDALVAADVLEHLEDPVGALRALGDLVRPEGALVFSLPNASHAAVLAGLLQGRWDHALEGIVADDHRTYAGWPGWERLLAAAGWRVESVAAAPAASRRLEPWRRVLSRTTGLSEETLTAVQWVGVARRSAPGEERRIGPCGAAAPELDDPVGEARRGVAAARRFVSEVPCAATAPVLAALLRGEVAAGAARRALFLGATPSGLRRRFAGCGLSVAVEASGAASDPLVTRVADAAAEARLPVDREALAAERLRVTAGPEGA